MKFMNESEIDMLQERWGSHPILGRAIKLLSDLQHLTNASSDGWAYWPKPCRAARKLMDLIDDASGRNGGLPAVKPTEAMLKAAVTPVKAFCTRNKSVLKGELHFPC